MQRRGGHAGVELDALDARAAELGREECAQRSLGRIDWDVGDEEAAVCGCGVGAGRVGLDVQVMLGACVRGGEAGERREGQREDGEVGDCGGRFTLERLFRRHV